MLDVQETFLAKVRHFLDHHGISKTAFGSEVLSDPSFVKNLEDGRSPRIDTVERVRVYMENYGKPPSKKSKKHGDAHA